ncbi:Synaptotagmin-2 [Echinococcus granulosus]|uniref:Synaptotagmin 2 n=1 Tax=Echinococcus granulosus TaxID=6210 RepID=A0A068WCA0_ECHGR|nr:Synaptotagmin-2 [Echinococcus granulosus]CDS17347.1 synaptotagmin 2 [Echinococcus granulosus]
MITKAVTSVTQFATTPQPDHLMSNSFLAWSGGVLNITNSALLIFVLILIFIAIILGCVLLICIFRCCCSKRQKHRPTYQKMPSLYVDQLPGQGGEVDALGTLEYSLEYSMKTNELKVGVIQVMDLSAKSASDQLDPYVKVILVIDDPVDKPKPKHKQRSPIYKTDIKHNCQSACFNEQFSYKLPYDCLKRAHIRLIVYDYDSNLKDLVVGEVFVSLEAIPMENYVGKTYEAVGYLGPSLGADDEPGQLCIVLKQVLQSEELHVHILEARQLALPLLHGKRYPDTQVSVTLHIGNKKLANKKTGFREGNVNPYFGETLIFNVRRDKLIVADLTCSIKYRAHGGLLRTFGKVHLGTTVNEASNQKQWNEMIQSPGRPVAMWHSIVPKILLLLNLVFTLIFHLLRNFDSKLMHD